MNNKFYFIGSTTYDYRPFGDANTPVNWNAFTRWLAEERAMEEAPEEFECCEYDECELVMVDGEVVGTFGKPLDRAPTAEEVEEFWEEL